MRNGETIEINGKSVRFQDFQAWNPKHPPGRAAYLLESMKMGVGKAKIAGIKRKCVYKGKNMKNGTKTSIFYGNSANFPKKLNLFNFVDRNRETGGKLISNSRHEAVKTPELS